MRRALAGAASAGVILTMALGLAALGGMLGGAVAYFGFNGFQTSTLNFQTFSQVAFAFAVTPVNDPPRFTAGSNQTVNEDAGSQTVNPCATAIS